VIGVGAGGPREEGEGAEGGIVSSTLGQLIHVCVCLTMNQYKSNKKEGEFLCKFGIIFMAICSAFCGSHRTRKFVWKPRGNCKGNTPPSEDLTVES